MSKNPRRHRLAALQTTVAIGALGDAKTMAIFAQGNDVHPIGSRGGAGS